MKRLVTWVVVVALLGGCAATPTYPKWNKTATPASAALQEAKLIHDEDARLARVAWRLAANGKAVCGSYVAPLAPFVWNGSAMTDKTSLKEADWQLYGYEPGRIYVEAIPGGHNEALLGDEILAIGSHKLPVPLENPTVVLDWMTSSVEHGELAVTLKGHGRVELPVETGCRGYSVVYPVRNKAVIYPTGQLVAVTEGLMRYADNDDELAFLYARALYLNNSSFEATTKAVALTTAGIFGALQALFPPLLLVPGTVPSLSTASVMASTYLGPADRAAFHLMVDAGYDPRVIPEWWAKLAKEKGVPDQDELRPSASRRAEWARLEATLTPVQLARIAAAHRAAKPERAANVALSVAGSGPRLAGAPEMTAHDRAGERHASY